MSVENVLFLCPGNYVRSILAEATLRHIAGERFRAFSAGAQPHRGVNPHVRALLKNAGYPHEGLRSKSLGALLSTDPPPFHYAITLCDGVEEAGCPSLPGQPRRAIWRLPDPCGGAGDEPSREAVERVWRDIRMLVTLFVRAGEHVRRGIAADPEAIDAALNPFRRETVLIP